MIKKFVLAKLYFIEIIIHVVYTFLSLTINIILHLIILLFFVFQKTLPIFATCVRNISADKSNLRDILAEKIPKEIQTIKEFRKQHGGTKVGEVTVDMVSYYFINFNLYTQISYTLCPKIYPIPNIFVLKFYF